ncbi:MAG TPA: DUF1475 family protein [bacterium]|nr:DUF1475 family protein [bacterium]
MKRALILYYILVFLVMTAVTTWASLTGNVLEGAAQVWALPWGRATFFDTYFAFLTFYLWVAYREKHWAGRVTWFLLIMALGNLAIAAYLIWRLAQLPARGTLADLLTGPKP